MDFGENSTDLVAWLEEALRKLLAEHKTVSAALVAEVDTGEVLTGYYAADARQKAIFAHNIQSDIILDVVLNNIGLVQEALADLEEEDEYGE